MMPEEFMLDGRVGITCPARFYVSFTFCILVEKVAMLSYSSSVSVSWFWSEDSDTWSLSLRILFAIFCLIASAMPSAGDIALVLAGR